MSISAVDLLVKLIGIPSPSNGERQICEYVFELLQGLPFDLLEKQVVDEGGFNIVACKGNPKIALQAHLDVVSPHIDARVTEDRIYGRGSCDTKSCVSAMILAASKALEEGMSDFALYFTVGEEKDFRGVKKLVASIKDLPFVVVGEPTNLEVVNGHYGIFVIAIESRGKKAHTSTPEQGVNAIDKLLLEIDKLKRFKPRRGSLMSLVTMNGGDADNVVPDYAKIEYSFRISPTDNVNYVKVFREKMSDDIRVKKGLCLKPVLTKVPRELSFLGEGKSVKYATELSFLGKGVVLGPGNIKLAHSADENIEKKELTKAVEVYFKILKEFS